uniref:Uncharacterized protein n=1 Tax=Arcella intermedia TaxID=1963864 RepID=A0A6B2LJR7_9EUKA
MVGDDGVGKTSMIVTYTCKKFPKDPRAYNPAMINHNLPIVTVDGYSITFNLWDTSGQAEYGRMRCLIYPQTDIFLCLFSVVSPMSFGHIMTQWYPEVSQHCPDALLFLVGTKSDLREDPEALKELTAANLKPVSYEEALQMAVNIKAVRYMECSALSGHGLNELFEEVARAHLPNLAKRPRGGCLLI